MTIRECDHQALIPIYILEGLSADEAESRGGDTEFGYREVVETVVEGTEEFAPTCDEVKDRVPAGRLTTAVLRASRGTAPRPEPARMDRARLPGEGRMDQLISQLVLGLVSGALLVLLALGLNLIFGLLEFINFSHGALYMVGAYLTSYLVVATGSIWPALLVVPVLMAAVGAGLERTLIRPMYGRDQVDALLLTFGLTYILIEGVRMIAGSGGRRVAAPDILRFQVNLGLGRPIPAYLLFVVVVVGLVVGGLWLFLQRTNVGLIVRAGIRDHVMIRALGVRFDRYRTLVFAIGVAVAGIAGVLTGPITGVYPEMGADILILAFVVVVVGGMGSFWGSVVAGLLIGVLVSLTTLYASIYAGIVPFVLMILVMTFRPRGLLGAT